ncbi:MAG: DUF2993 domain-containing protein [Actinomycetota bacterium]
MRRLAVSLIIIALVLCAIDYLAKDYVAGRVEVQLQRGLDIPRRPEVAIDSFPFLLAVLRGRVDALELQASAITVDRIPFTQVRVALEEVTFAAGDILSGKARSVSAQSGNGNARLTGAALQRIVARQSSDLVVRVRGDTVTLSTSENPQPIAAEVSLQNKALVITATAGLEEIVIPLPEITSGLVYRNVTVADSAIALGFRLERPRLKLAL